MAPHPRRSSRRQPYSNVSATGKREFMLPAGYGWYSFPQNHVAHLNVFKRGPPPVPLLSPGVITVKTLSPDSARPARPATARH